MIVTTKRLGAATAAVVIVLTLIWYVAAFRPESARVKTAHQAYAAASAKANDLQSQVNALQALVRQIPADTARLAQVNAALPLSPDLNSLLTQLDALATRTGVQLTSVSPSPATSTAGSSTGASSGGGAKSITLPLSASGTYAALTSFLTGLKTMPRALVVSSISLSPGGAGQMSASLNTKVYYAS